VSSDLETRVEALEAEVARLREDGATTRAIAALADRDVAEIRTTHRATTAVLNALRETQLEQGQALQTIAGAVAGLTTQVAGLDAKVSTLDAKVSTLDAKVSTLAEGQARHEQILTQHGEMLTEILRRLPAPPGQG
jgi:chromosome segregation ATPase